MERWFETAREAIEYVLSDYWVEATHVSDEQEAWKFNIEVQPLDWSESGMVHFARRNREKQKGGRPTLSTESNVKVEIVMPSSLRDKLNRLADGNRSAWIRQAIEQA